MCFRIDQKSSSPEIHYLDGPWKKQMMILSYSCIIELNTWRNIIVNVYGERDGLNIKIDNSQKRELSNNENES